MTLSYRLATMAVLGMLGTAAYGQGAASDSYHKFRDRARHHYEDFRHKANKEYIGFLGGEWIEGTVQQPTVSPAPDDSVPVPPEPTVLSADTVSSRELPSEYIGMAPVQLQQPQPLGEITNDLSLAQPTVEFKLYGMPCEVRFDDSQQFSIDGSPQSFMDAWEGFLTPEYDNTLYDCLRLRDDMQLCDWAYKELLRSFTEEIFGDSSEAQMLMAYLYSQTGYDMRLMVSNDGLHMFYAADCKLPLKYVVVDGCEYFTDHPVDGSLSICPAGFPNEQPLSLLISQPPTVRGRLSTPRVHTSGPITTTLNIDESLIEFFANYPKPTERDGYPMWQWQLYGSAPMTPQVKRQLYPVLRQQLEGKSELEAVNMLLNYLQDGFAYKVDNEVWGQERTFFAEETLYYPYCDCEDRSILLSRLVRDLLGLDTALVYYPGHMGMAVKFNEEVPGDYVAVDSDRYVIADPNIRGGKAGETMASHINEYDKVKVLVLKSR